MGNLTLFQYRAHSISLWALIARLQLPWKISSQRRKWGQIAWFYVSTSKATPVVPCPVSQPSAQWECGETGEGAARVNKGSIKMIRGLKSKREEAKNHEEAKGIYATVTQCLPKTFSPCVPLVECEQKTPKTPCALLAEGLSSCSNVWYHNICNWKLYKIQAWNERKINVTLTYWKLN